MRIHIAAILCLLAATTLALTGCGGGGNNAPGAASFLYTMSCPNFLLDSTSINSYPAGVNGISAPAVSSTPLIASDVGRGVQGDRMGNLYTLSTAEGPSCCVLTVNVYSAAGGVLTLKRSFNYSNSNVTATSFTVDPTGIVYVSAAFGTTGLVGTMLKFAANASGAATPTIFGGAPGYFFRMATDTAGNLYAYDGGGTVLEYSAGDTSGMPSKTLNLFAFGTTPIFSNRVADMAIDSAGNIYLLGQAQTFLNFISEYSSAAGTTTPMKTIGGLSTLMHNPVALAVDAAGNIYEEDAPTFTGAGHSNTILTFSASATGNVAPTNVFVLAATDFNPSFSDVRTGLVAY